MLPKCTWVVSVKKYLQQYNMFSKGAGMSARFSDNDDIDLFVLVEQLWDSKLTIIFFTIASVFMSGLYSVASIKHYESRLSISIDTIPPFYTSEQSLNDFERLFYDKFYFDSWKQLDKVTTIEYKNFSGEQVVDGITVVKSEGQRLAIVKILATTSGELVVKSDDLSVLNDFFEYAEYVNSELQNHYVSRARAELEIYEARFNDLKSSDESIIRNVLSIDRYIVAAERGAKVLKVNRPTLPKETTASLKFLLVVGAVLGGVLGAVYILVVNAWHKHVQNTRETN